MCGLLIEDFEKTAGHAGNVELSEDSPKTLEIPSAHSILWQFEQKAKGRPKPLRLSYQVSKTSCKLLKHGNHLKIGHILPMSIYS